MDSTSRTRRAARRRFATGITVASTGILAASLVAVPPDHHAAQVEYQAIRLAAITAPWPGITGTSPKGGLRESPTPRDASAAATPTAAESASGIQNTLGNLVFAALFFGALVSAGLLMLPVAVLGFVIAVPKAVLGAIKTLIDKVTSGSFRRPTVMPAANSGIAAITTRSNTRPGSASATAGRQHRSTRTVQQAAGTTRHHIPMPGHRPVSTTAPNASTTTGQRVGSPGNPRRAEATTGHAAVVHYCSS